MIRKYKQRVQRFDAKGIIELFITSQQDVLKFKLFSHKKKIRRPIVEAVTSLL